MKGKVTYHSKLAGEADLVAFHPAGDTVRDSSGKEQPRH